MKTEDALKDKIVGVYFSAHWCVPNPGLRGVARACRHPRIVSTSLGTRAAPEHIVSDRLTTRARPSLRSRRCPPCRQFTPIFGEIYKELKSRGKNFEVVFASSDRDEASFAEYHGEQPWLAMPIRQSRSEE